MKKIIALLLAVVMCLSLCACGGNEAKTQLDNTSDAEIETTVNSDNTDATTDTIPSIAGEWHLANGDAKLWLSINEDGTGTYFHDNTSNELRWKYDEELQCYTIAVGEVVSAFLKDANGIAQLLIGTNIYVHPEDIGKINNNVSPAPSDDATMFVGEWKAYVKVSSENEYEVYVITLNADGTGSYREHSGTWEYSKENNVIALTVPTGKIALEISDEDGKTILKFYQDTYYRANEFVE